MCRVTRGDCERERISASLALSFASLESAARQAYEVFTLSSTQLNIGFGVIAGLHYAGVMAVCRALGYSWPEVFPYVQALEVEFVLSKNTQKDGAPP